MPPNATEGPPKGFRSPLWLQIDFLGLKSLSGVLNQFSGTEKPGNLFLKSAKSTKELNLYTGLIRTF